jgi:hypothetical protein
MPGQDNYGAKQACISYMAVRSPAPHRCLRLQRVVWCGAALKREQVTGDDGLNYSEHKCNDDSQVKQPAV